MKRAPLATFVVFSGLAWTWGCGSPAVTGPGVSGAGETSRVGGSFSAPQVLTRAEDFSFHVTSDWQTGYGASLELVNSGAQSLRDWRLEFDFASRIDTLWNARIVSHSGNHYVLAG